MPKNRGKEGRDDYLFGESFMKRKIKEAVYDMSFLLERGYGEASSCELVGNRYKLNKRQQQAIKGMSAGESAIQNRKSRQRSIQEIKNQALIIDGFNQLILLESMLSEAYLFQGKDGAYRDLSRLHGTYKKVNQTLEAIDLVKDFCSENSINKVVWVFDKPVSNSGRMKTLLNTYAEENGLNWEILLENNPDKVIAESKDVVLTSDAWILDRVNSWYNLIEDLIPKTYSYLVSC
ncbi:hypothetical protein SAMN04489761_2220 [Tenacibaculum sp. MAR_2009_124]|uniref:DUF434 domain-containing protein n=1 Tax=Tenacibaculum sp. MAR_2009_124 TaxID=1250059 RepID=UPI0008955029|nr:DUF434 domain-containing protein [Tenacibaculum sp. MAR_2009_124]SEC00269.1 hypothetical protein SAMN04489761_2220 [Tenacibaculum sp. MAR_2009_124]